MLKSKEEGNISFIFFFNDTTTTEIYTLSLHDALPISPRKLLSLAEQKWVRWEQQWRRGRAPQR